MPQQILIIGLGMFGMALARTISDKGVEVLAGDRRQELVDEAAAFVTEAVVIDATDEAALARLHPKERDCAVCAIGDDSKEASIICTALLRQMGAPWVIGRANNPMHRRILQLVGAHLVVNPEEEYGRRFANRLLYRNVISDMPLGEDLHLTEMTVHESMVGKTLVELALPRRFGVMVVAIRRGEQGKVLQPLPNDPLMTGDRLIIARNGHSIKACEDLITLFALAGDRPFTESSREKALAAVAKIRGNITEPEEPAFLDVIERDLAAAFRGETKAREAAIGNLVQLSRVNQVAMVKADRQAQQLGQAGAWGVMFMAVAAFLAGLFFLRGLNRRVVAPMEEIHVVLRAHRNNESMRRCTGTDLPQDMQAVFTGINELLDQCQARTDGGPMRMEG